MPETASRPLLYQLERGIQNIIAELCCEPASPRAHERVFPSDSRADVRLIALGVALTTRAVVHYAARASLAMAAISLSARDIEERLQAVQQRWQWRVRLHAGAYVCSVALVAVAGVAWVGGTASLVAQWGWLTVLVASASVLVTLLVSAPLERAIDRERTAAWIDARAGLEHRLTTFVAFDPQVQRSRLFPVLVLQLIRSLPRYDPKQLVPWKPAKPLAALSAATLLLVLAWRQGEPARQPTLAEHSAASAQSREHAREIERGDDAAASVTGERGDSDPTSQDLADTAQALPGSDVALGLGTRRDTTARDGKDRGSGEVPVAGARFGGHREAPARLSSHTPEGSSGRGSSPPAAEAVAAGRLAANAPPVARSSGGPSNVEFPAQQKAQGEQAFPGAGQPRPEPERPLAGQPAPHGQSPAKGQSGAGSGTDGAGLYGAAAPPAGHGSAAPSERIVVTLPATTFVRSGFEPQGAGAKGMPSVEPSEGGQVAGSGASVQIEKPLLPPAYRELAQRVFARTAKP